MKMRINISFIMVSRKPLQQGSINQIIHSYHGCHMGESIETRKLNVDMDFHALGSSESSCVCHTYPPVFLPGLAHRTQIWSSSRSKRSRCSAIATRANSADALETIKEHQKSESYTLLLCTMNIILRDIA